MSEKEREQNEKTLHEYLNRKAEEQFFRMAAEEIDAEDDRLFAQAQELPDPDDETMARLEAGLQTAMKKARRRAQRRRWLHGLGRVAAGVAIVSGGLFAGAYLTVDATRNAVNNFVLEAFDGYAQMETEESEEQSGPTMPAGWDGPFAVGCGYPTRFVTSVTGSGTHWNVVIYTMTTKISRNDRTNLSYGLARQLTPPHTDIERYE